MTINTILLQKTAPINKGVVWARPISGGFGLYIFNNGNWQPLKLIYDSGTTTTDDDVLADSSNFLDFITALSDRISVNETALATLYTTIELPTWE